MFQVTKDGKHPLLLGVVAVCEQSVVAAVCYEFEGIDPSVVRLVALC